MLTAIGMRIIHWGYKSIPTLGVRLNEARSCCQVAERLADSIDCLIQATIKIDERVARPDPGLQLLSGHQLPRALQQCSEHLKRLVLQLDFDSTLSQFARFEIDLEDAETDWRLRWHRRWGMQPCISILFRRLHGNKLVSKNQLSGHRILSPCWCTLAQSFAENFQEGIDMIRGAV